MNALSVAMVAALGVTGHAASVFAQSETPAEKAAREIQEARDRANEAAGAFFDAQSSLELLIDDLAKLEIEEARLQADVDRLRAQVESVAVSRFIESGTEGIPLLTDVSEPQDQVQTDVFVDVVTNTGADTIDEFDAAQTALLAAQDDVAERQAEVEAQKAEFANLEQAALDEVERLREIENDRLQDEAVKKALEAQLAKERAAIEEQARLDAEAAARAQPNPGLVVPPSTSTTIPVPAGTTPDGESIPVDTQPPVEVADAPPTETTLPPNGGASGGTSGGRTGGGGGGNNPAGVGGQVVNGLVCPLPGGAYDDTWGAPRSGGRRHEGVDIIAPRGLPIYAVVGGVVSFKSNRLGGNAVSLVGDDGNRYYYAHLDSYVGTSRRVFQGEHIGFNGDTGNAKFSTPHLHFQVHPGGGQAVNPTPTVRLAGC
jgi:murein DD-endopeptidase MepM/ murein hydrolase activator NlpD